MEKALKSEDRHRQGLEIDPAKVLKSMHWKPENYHVDDENKEVYIKDIYRFFFMLGVNINCEAQSKMWRGWTWKRGGKRVKEDAKC